MGTLIHATPTSLDDVRDDGDLGDTGRHSWSGVGHAELRADLASGRQDRLFQIAGDRLYTEDAPRAGIRPAGGSRPEGSIASRCFGGAVSFRGAFLWSERDRRGQERALKWSQSGHRRRRSSPGEPRRSTSSESAGITLIRLSAQRPKVSDGGCEAPIATATARRRSLQRMVRCQQYHHHLIRSHSAIVFHSLAPVEYATSAFTISSAVRSRLAR